MPPEFDCSGAPQKGCHPFCLATEAMAFWAPWVSLTFCYCHNVFLQVVDVMMVCSKGSDVDKNKCSGSRFEMNISTCTDWETVWSAVPLLSHLGAAS